MTAPVPADDDFVLEINSRRGIPLDLVSYLLRAIGAVYPNTYIRQSAGRRPTLELCIPKADLHLHSPDDMTDADLAALGGEKEIAELTAFTSGWRDGALGLQFPDWLSRLLQVAAEQMVEAMSPEAENYVAIDIARPNGDPFTWIVCRPGRPSPHDLRMQAEQERDEARELVHRLADNLAMFVGDHSDPGTEALAALWCAHHTPLPDGAYRTGTDQERRDALARLICATVEDAVKTLRTDAGDAWDRERPPSRETRDGFDHALDCVTDDLPDLIAAALLGKDDPR